MLQALPPEVVELIVEEIGNDYGERRRLETLKACSLTSHSFSKPARKQIFRSLSLVEDFGGDDEQSQEQLIRLQKLEDIITHDPFKSDPRQPPLPFYIKSVNLRLSRRRLNSNSSPTMQNNGGFRFSDSVLIRILHKMEHVCNMGILVYPHSPTTPWTDVNFSLRTFLESFLLTRPIRMMGLAGFSAFPMRILTHCYSLKMLSLKHFRMPNWEIPPQNLIWDSAMAHIKPLLKVPVEDLDPWPPQLLFLRVLCAAEVTSHLSAVAARSKSAIFFPFFAIEIGPCFAEEEWITMQTFPYLLHLICHVPRHGPLGHCFPTIADYGLLKHLITLEIHCDLDSTRTNAGLKELVTRWNFFNVECASMTPSSIETLIIHGNWVECTTRNHAGKFWPRSGWLLLDRVLTSGRFPKLTNLQLDLSLDWWEGDPLLQREPSLLEDIQPEVKNKLRRLLPSVMKLRSVQVDISIEVRSHPPPGIADSTTIAW